MPSRRTFRTTKICAQCKVEKTHSFFIKIGRKKFMPYCRPCHNERQRIAYLADPAKFKDRVRARRMAAG
jgi:hypothetical protein